MKMYLVSYGADNFMMTFSADDTEHARDQFKDAEPDADINEIYVCTPAEPNPAGKRTTAAAILAATDEFDTPDYDQHEVAAAMKVHNLSSEAWDNISYAGQAILLDGVFG